MFFLVFVTILAIVGAIYQGATSGTMLIPTIIVAIIATIITSSFITAKILIKKNPELQTKLLHWLKRKVK